MTFGHCCSDALRASSAFLTALSAFFSSFLSSGVLFALDFRNARTGNASHRGRRTLVPGGIADTRLREERATEALDALPVLSRPSYFSPQKYHETIHANTTNARGTIDHH